jgi:hypothetical protein
VQLGRVADRVAEHDQRSGNAIDTDDLMTGRVSGQMSDSLWLRCAVEPLRIDSLNQPASRAGTNRPRAHLTSRLLTGGTILSHSCGPSRDTFGSSCRPRVLQAHGPSPGRGRRACWRSADAGAGGRSLLAQALR